MEWWRSAVGLFAWLAICGAAAQVGGLFTELSVGTWYPTLTKPVWTPSGMVIGTVWAVLYTMMALAAWLVWRRGGLWHQRWPLSWFILQLMLNVAWSALFFGLRSPGLAALELVALWTAILITLLSFWKVSRLAGVLMVPYLGWVTFAGVLNVWIWWLNSVLNGTNTVRYS
jgi:tryptophan-rich sensory protein